MRIFIISVLLVLTYLQGFSQDLVVTSENDSISCRIVKIQKKILYFVYENKGSFTNSLIPLTKVKNYTYGHYPNLKIPNKLDSTKTYNVNRLAILAGVGYDPIRVPREFEADLRGIRTGIGLQATYSYYYSKYSGVGIKTSIFSASFNQDSSRSVNTFFIGPLFSIRLPNKTNKNAFVFDTSIGFIAYNETLEISSNSFNNRTTSAALGLTSDLGYDIEVSKNLSLGFNLGLSAGFYKEVEIDDGTSIQTFDLEDSRPVGSAYLSFFVGLVYKN